METLWVGCDCDRWYHKFCALKLVKRINAKFSCRSVKMRCIGQAPPKQRKRKTSGGGGGGAGGGAGKPSQAAAKPRPTKPKAANQLPSGYSAVSKAAQSAFTSSLQSGQATSPSRFQVKQAREPMTIAE